MSRYEINEEDEELYDYFLSFVKNYHDKPINLNQSKDDIFADFYARMLNNELSSAKAFYKIIQKSYAEYKPDELRPYVSLIDLNIKKPIDLLSKFISDYVTDQPVVCKNYEDAMGYIARAVADRMEATFGDFVYFNNTKMKDSFIKVELEKTLQQKGYKQYKNDSKLLINLGLPKGITKTNQKILLNAYCEMAEVFVADYVNHLKHKQNDFDALWKTVKLTLENIEGNLSETSKNDARFVADKKKVNDFFNKHLKEVIEKKSKTSLVDEYVSQIRQSMKNASVRKATQEEMDNIKEFYSTILKLDEALSIVDEKGRNYPANYFVYSKVLPNKFLELITKAQTYDFWTDEQKKMLAQTKTKIRRSFPNISQKLDIGKSFTVREVLNTRFNGIRSNNDSFNFDVSTEKAYEEFVSKVEGYIEKYGLAVSELCVSLIGGELSRGREPICIKEDKKISKNRSKE